MSVGTVKSELTTKNNTSQDIDQARQNPNSKNENAALRALTMTQSEYMLLQNLVMLYGEGRANHLAKHLLAIARDELDDAPVAIKQKTNLFSAEDRLLIAYGDSIRDEPNTPLSALERFAIERLDGSISGIHILPFFPSSSDDGFAVIDYNSVREDLGGWEDINALSKHFDLMFDLVINHCSRENLWFADFIGGKEPGRFYFHEMPSMMGLENVVRPRNSPLLTQVHTYEGIKKVWTTFSDDQVDLNFANPDVLCEFVRVLFSYIAKGARFIRLDAIAFLWKELGTSSINLEQTHAVVRVLRALTDELQTQTILLTETNVPHQENISYFGSQDEAHLIYQFSLAPLLLYSYLFNNGQYLGLWAQRLGEPPFGCNFVNFIASHDGIGLRPLEGLVPNTEIQKLTDKIHQRGGYAALRSNADGEDSVYELNIALFSAFGGRLENVPAYLAAHQLMMALQGVPAIYVNALVGGLNDLDGVESSGRTRSINRGHWRLDSLEEALNQENGHQSIIFNELCRDLRLRGAQSAFSPLATQRVVSYDENHLCFERQSDSQRILVIASFSDEPTECSLSSQRESTHTALDILTEETFKLSKPVALAPYQVRWFSMKATNA